MMPAAALLEGGRIPNPTVVVESPIANIAEDADDEEEEAVMADAWSCLSLYNTKANIKSISRTKNKFL